MVMEPLQKESIQALKALVDESSKVAVVGHSHPDGDALGCTSALAVFLQCACGKDAACVFPDVPAENLQFLLSAPVPFLFLDREPEPALRRIREADLICLLDCNNFSRTDGLQEALAASRAPKILVDHHLNPDREAFDLVFSVQDISSASELLYWILKELNGADLPVTIGTPLMAGMTTDTNNFANSVYPSTFRMASELLAAGVNRDALLLRLFSSYRENRVRLMGYMQNEGLHLLPCGAAYMILTKDIQERFDFRKGETEGLVNIPLTIASVRLSVFLKEDDGHFRVSVRSKTGTSAQQLAHRFFHGGGHENASGGKLLIGEDIATAADASAYVENAIKTFLS